MNSIISFFQNFMATLTIWVLPNVFKVFLIVLIAFFVQYLIHLGIENFIKQSRRIKRAETLSQISHSTSKVIITTIAIMMVLHELGFNVIPIIASAGVLGFAFSLGAQSLMKDVINGFFILLEDQFGIGDLVKIGDHSGIVEKMNLRTTTLKDSNGSIHIIPNSQVDKVTVLSQRH